jgi:myo-inositol-1(or 4)-monophosphatase
LPTGVRIPPGPPILASLTIRFMLTKDQEVIVSSAKQAGEIIKNYFDTDLEVTVKSIEADFLTKADVEAEQKILEVLSKHFPNYNYMAEESGNKDTGSEYTFIIDPLDGSNNFKQGIAYFGVSIALLKNGKTIFAVIYEPILDNMYFAIDGKGSYKNRKQVFVSKENNMERFVVGYHRGYVSDESAYLQLQKKFPLHKGIMRFLHSWCVTIDYCKMAEGKVHAIINNGCEIHDYVAGKLIAKEAGAIIKTYDGKKIESEKQKQFITANTQKTFEIVSERVQKVFL